METRLTPNRRQRNRIATAGVIVAAVLVLAALLAVPAGAPDDPAPEVAAVAEAPPESATATVPVEPGRIMEAVRAHVRDAQVIALAGAVHERRVIEYVAAVAEAERVAAEQAAREAREAERREKAREESTARTPTRAAAAAPTTGSCSGWGDLVAAHFPASQVAKACSVLACESGGNPSASSSTNDHGLLQIHAGSAGFPGGWQDTFRDVTGASFFNGVYDPNLNLMFGAWLWRQSGWSPWACA